MTLPVVQEFYTARELADLAEARGLAGFSERNIRALATREAWTARGQLVRRREAGEAGGRPGVEYHRSLLPEALQALIAARASTGQQLAAHARDAEADSRRLAALRTSALPARARAVMEARAEILTSIDGFAIAHGEPRAWGIARFLEAQDDFRSRQDIEAARDAGRILTERELASLARPLDLVSAGGFHLDPTRIALANDRRGAGAVKRSALYDWFKSRDEQGVIALAPVPPKVAEPIPPGFAEFLRFYAIPSKPTAADAHVEYLKAAARREGTGPMTLTLGQVRRILRERLSSIEKAVGREGLLTLRSRMAYVTRTTEDMWPTTIYTADGKTFDAEVADPVTKRPIRPEITTVLDVVTRKVVGTSLARSENQRSVAEALRNACVGHGIPAIFYVDRGPGYRNEAMDADVSGLMGRLGITKMHAAPYGSQAKGRIERPNATIWDVLAKRLPTYIGQDMDKEAGQKVHKLTRREIKEFGQSRLLPSWEDFVRLCEERVAEYNATPHRSLPKFEDPQTGRLRHMSPDEAWAAHVTNGFVPVPVDSDEADDLFRPYEIRTVRRALVQWNGNSYYHDDLEAWHERKVMVGYDYHQADRVWVREFDVESGQPGRLICVARFGGNSERYVPLSYEQAAIETRAKGRLRRIDAKRDAIEAERDALMIESAPVEIADFIDVTPAEITPVLALVSDGGGEAIPGPQPSRRRVFASDEELAAWALEHPAELRPNQIAVLRDCLSRPAARELFRLSGIDVEALRTLLRAVA